MDELLEQLKIRHVLERCSRGLDRMDGDLIARSYWPDAVVDLGPWTGAGAEVADLLLPILAQHATTQHMLCQSNIEVDGSRAAGDTYFQGFHRGESDAGVSMMVAYGRYVDLFEKRDGEWRIIKRTVVMEHMETLENVQSAGLTMDMFRTGRRGDRSDLSYEGRNT